MKVQKAVAWLGVSYALSVDVVNACTVFAAGKKATKDGSVIISHSDDGDPNNDARLIYVPAADYAPGSFRAVFYTPENYPRYVGPLRGPDYMPDDDTKAYNTTGIIGWIDQVNHTYGYQDSSYGVLNEHGVSVAESTCGAAFGTCGRGSSIGCEPGRKVGVALFSIDTLSSLAVERSRTSREAVELMGAFASKYGFYGPPDSFEGSGESLVVGDPDEAWAFQILSDPSGTSAIWAAQRVPDTDFTVVANMFTIREVNFNDKANFILSPNLVDAAKERGWWKEGEPFDFTKMYSGGEYAHKYYSGRRMWRGFSMAAPSVKLPAEYEDIRYKPAYPWSVKPDKLITHHDFFAWHRDWYAGTKYDMTKGIQAGPFGSPDRFATSSKVKGHWERSIALYRTNAVYVQHLQHPGPGKPPGTASVAWFGAGAAHYAPFVPIPSGVSRSIHPLRFADPSKFEAFSMNWLVRKVMDICQIRFDKMHPMVEAAQQRAEESGDALIARVREWGPDKPSEELNKIVEKHALTVLADWQKLTADLIFHYSDNYDNLARTPLSYPDFWLEKSGYENGPPDAPVEDQCPPKCSGPHKQTEPEVIV
eukprot:TRINITY_DN94588_c0_g1_i1.p1 TRINITY_DN94588_c0_g1~~TRINITY_DN94588_c0_g1_i1.p1  ORF type:complete len:591 (-),score=109.31 TRINITY_DN94588_c0_g1_i1:30-1802(-)